MLRAAIFDMDGLLIDSEPLWRQVHMEVLAGHKVIITENEIRGLQGTRTTDVVEHWRQRYDLQHIPTEVLEASIVDKLISHVRERGTALEGAHDLMQELHKHRIPMAVASSSPPEVIETVINKLAINQYIKLACSGYDEEFGKPDPAVYLTTAQGLAVAPEDCVAFEDSVNGLKAAKAAGMKCVAVPEAVQRSRAEFQQADLVLHSLADATWRQLRGLWP